MNNRLCTLLSWDSDFWGFPIAKINVHQLTEETASQAVQWSKERKVKCLYFSADGRCAATLAAAGSSGFRYVDVRVDMARSVLEPGAESGGFICREAVAEDSAALQQMARVSHGDTRFFKDLNFDRGKAGELYATWIARDLREQKVFIAVTGDDAETLLGYVSASASGEREGRIGLVAVNAEARGRGVGRLLVQRALGWFQSCGVGSVNVATQGTNIPALRLYESCGFMVADVKVWFHRWFSD